MNQIESSIWGILLVLAVFGLSIILLFVVDQRLLRRLFSFRCHVPSLPVWLWLVVTVAMLAGSAALAGCLALCFSAQAFLPAWAVILLCLAFSTPRSVETYLRSLRHTEAHRRYLLASGASHLESVVPSVRRALRSASLPMLWQRRSPMLLAMPMMCFTLLLCGNTLTAALVAMVLTWAAALAASLASCVLALWLADYKLFDKRRNLTVARGNS